MKAMKAIKQTDTNKGFISKFCIKDRDKKL